MNNLYILHRLAKVIKGRADLRLFLAINPKYCDFILKNNGAQEELYDLFGIQDWRECAKNGTLYGFGS